MLPRIVVFLSLVALAACSHDRPAGATDREPSSVDSLAPDSVRSIYTCPMHPEVIQDRPGTCPSCGMDLQIRS